MNEQALIALMFKWVAELPNRAFELEYGYGICEVPWVKLLNECKEVWSGPLSEFQKWVAT